MPFLNLASGIILVLLGIRYLRKGLDRLFGSRLIDWLQTMTRNRLQAFLAGAVAGVVAPSSSAIAMLSVQMLNRTALTAGRMLAVVLGANIGITVSVQLLALQLQQYSGAFLLLGGIGFLFSKRAIFRGAGQMLLGMGLIFLAMEMIGEAGTVAAVNPDLKLLFGIVEHYPLLVFLATALLTVALQSSTASIGLGIGLARSGLLPGSTMVPWVLGANLGITLTMMIAGWASTEGRRLAIGSLLIKGIGTVALLFAGTSFSSFLVKFFPGTIDRQAANLNTLFNLILGVAALPLLSPIYRVVAFLVESRNIDGTGEADSYLDPLLLQAPSLALNQAAREELRLVDELKVMLRTVWTMLWAKSIHLVRKLEEHQNRIERTQEALKDYLNQISDENLNEEDVDWKFILLDYSQELTTIGTLIKRDLSDAAVRQVQSKVDLLPDDKAELESLYVRTLERMEKAILILLSRQSRPAEEFIREKEQINMQVRFSRKARLEKPLSVHDAVTNVVDLVDCIRRINSQLTSLAYSLVRDSSRSTIADGQIVQIKRETMSSAKNEAGQRENQLLSIEK